MIPKKSHKILFKCFNILLGENILKEYMPVWWKNTRRTGGLRLTDEGFEFITERLELKVYEVSFPVDFTPTTWLLYFRQVYQLSHR